MTSFIAGLTVIGVIYLIAKVLTLTHNRVRQHKQKTIDVFVGLLVVILVITLLTVFVSFLGDLVLSVING